MAQTSPASLPARSWTAYQPLIVTALVALLSAYVLKLVYLTPFIPVFAGFWLTQFAMIKLFDIEDFASKFGQYDLFAMKLYAWGFLFPFFQLALGLAYLAHFSLDVVSIVLIIVAIINLIGIFRRVKEDAAFAGRYFLSRTPLRDAAIIENALMILMGLGYFLAYKFFWGAGTLPVSPAL